MKVLNPLKRYLKNQEASYNFKLGFALSKRPHFNSVYLVRVPFLNGIAVKSHVSKPLTYIAVGVGTVYLNSKPDRYLKIMVNTT